MTFENPITKLSQLIADFIQGATIIGGVITGADIRTADTGKRWEILSTGANLDTISGYSGDPLEIVPGVFSTFVNTLAGNTIALGTRIAGPRWLGTLANRPKSFIQFVTQAANVQDIDIQVAQGGTLSFFGGGDQSDKANTVPATNLMSFNSSGFAIGSGVASLRALDIQAYSGTTDVNGDLVVAHGLGFTPTFVGVMHATGAGTVYPQKVTGRNSSQFTIHFQNSTTGAAGNGAAVTGTYLAIAT